MKKPVNKLDSRRDNVVIVMALIATMVTAVAVERYSWTGFFIVGAAFYGAIMALLYLVDLVRGKTKRGEARDSGTIGAGFFVIQLLLIIPFVVFLEDALPGKPESLQHVGLSILALIGYMYLSNRFIDWLVPEKPTKYQ